MKKIEEDNKLMDKFAYDKHGHDLGQVRMCSSGCVCVWLSKHIHNTNTNILKLKRYEDDHRATLDRSMEGGTAYVREMFCDAREDTNTHMLDSLDY